MGETLGDDFYPFIKVCGSAFGFYFLDQGDRRTERYQPSFPYGIRTITIYIGTTVMAITVGLLLVNLIHPGKVFPREKAEEYRGRYEQTVDEKKKAAEEIKDAGPLAFLVDMVPENLIQAGSDNTKMLQIIFVALLFGIAMVAVGGEKMKVLMSALDAADTVILKIIDYIMEFAPLGVLGLMASLVVDSAGNGEIFAALGMYAFTVAFSLFLLIFLFYPALLRLFTSVKIKQFFRAMSPVQLLAFLPVRVPRLCL